MGKWQRKVVTVFLAFIGFLQTVTCQSERWAIEAPRSSNKARGSNVLITYNMSDEMKSSIVDMNNLVRSTVEPPAANMRRITWDDDLQKLATDYSKQCLFAINKKKKMDRFRRVEELIYVSQGIDFDERYPVQATGRWNEEGRFYDYEANKCSSRSGCTRYTQMMWADTFKVGCGISKCSAILVKGRVWTDATIMVCDYVPGGNWINRRPYVTGEVCSECHESDTCVDNLCSNPARDSDVRQDAVWSDWSAWSQCPVTCGMGGSSRRTRYCSTFVKKDCSSNPFARTMQFNFNCAKHIPCPGTFGYVMANTARFKLINIRADWNRWDNWSPCTKKCGGGISMRTRTCSSGEIADCAGPSVMKIPCNMRPCPRWNSWRPWEGCSSTCGGGTRIRSRACSSGNDADCEGSKTETGRCNEQSCSPTPEWEEWQNWGVCSQTCGGGHKSRSRSCNTGNDEDCVGDNQEMENCNDNTCPEWGEWKPWQDCSATCGSGEKVRMRVCNTGNDEDCVGSNKEIDACNEGPCLLPDWNMWQEWGPCTVPCDGGERTRNRTCSSGKDEDCVGSNTETQACNKQPCAQAESGSAEWHTWQAWSACSYTCGLGQKTRKRSCNTGVDEDCDGDNEEMKYCIENECPEWDAWKAWGDCSVSCGDGSRMRTRTCNTGNEKDCKGSDRETESCSQPPCIVAEWSKWTRWSKCFPRCGPGTKTRSRTCINGEVGAEGCIGEETGSKPCKVRNCPRG